MGETSVHRGLIDYLALVLKWLLHGRLCAIYENLNFYQTSDPKEYPLAPDIAVIKGVSFQHVRSWRVGKTGPAPQVVFEIASEETWKSDLQEKPGKYARMGSQNTLPTTPMSDPSIARRLVASLAGTSTRQKVSCKRCSCVQMAVCGVPSCRACWCPRESICASMTGRVTCVSRKLKPRPGGQR
ncbi:MAG: Uma2 family endonuclease [Ktedonobacteraceae bacterium]